VAAGRGSLSQLATIIANPISKHPMENHHFMPAKLVKINQTQSKILTTFREQAKS
jgi:hypothetical protein